MKFRKLLTAGMVLASLVGCGRKPKCLFLITKDATTERIFYDRDLDGKTVERYQEIKWSEYGTDVDGKVVLDIERDSMSELQRDRIDEAYIKAQKGE